MNTLSWDSTVSLVSGIFKTIFWVAIVSTQKLCLSVDLNMQSWVFPRFNFVNELSYMGMKF